MLYAFLFSSIIGNIFVSISKNSGVFKKIMLVISFLFLWILLGWSFGAYDVEIGINRYINYQSFESFTEIGYTLLVKLGHAMNMSYRTFFVICSFFELLVMFWFVDKNSDHPVVVILLFMIYPLVIYLQYIRNIAAFSFILIAFDAVMNRKRGYVIKYIIFVLLGIFIHFDSLYFLVLTPFFVIKSKKVCVVSAIVLFGLLFVFASSSWFLDIVGRLLGDEKVFIIAKISDAEGQIGRVLTVALAQVQFWFIYILVNKVLKVEIDEKFDHFFFVLNMFSIILIPFTMYYAVGFARFPILLSIVNYIYYVNAFSRINDRNDKIYMYSILIIFMLTFLYLNFRNEAYRELVLYPFFEQNELVNS